MSGWPTATLGEIAQPKQWPTLSMSEMATTGFPVYGANGRIGYTVQFTHERPTILIGCRGSCGTVHITEPQSYANGNAMALDALDESRVDIHFLAHFLAQRGFRDVTTGTSQPQIIRQNLVRVLVPLPPLPEQRRIAEILDKADALRAKRRAALAQLDTLIQSIFLDMFGDPATNPKGWPLKALSALGEISTGKTPPTGNEGMFGGAIPFATPGDLDAKLESTQRTITLAGSAFTKIVRPGSALVGCIGNIGKMAKTPVATAFNQQINAVEWGRDVNDDYGIAALVFAVPQMLALASSTTVPILNKTGFSKVRLPVPPLSIQRDFALRISAVGELTSTHRTALQLAESLFGSLQHRAFRGEL